MKNIRNIYLIGICGAGMSALAAMLKESGYDVSGSDTNIYPPSSDVIKKHNINYLTGYKKENINSQIDLVIIGNVCRRDNPEVLRTIELNLPFKSFADAIRDLFIKDKESIVVTGTHGKSTTTAMISWIFEVADKNPSFMIGAIPLNFDSNFQSKISPYFIIEGDEYDSAYFQKEPKFLHYKPKHVIIGSVEFDHCDIYSDQKAYDKAFVDLIKTLPKDHTLFINEDYSKIKEIVEPFNNLNIISYGTKDENSKWYATNIKFESHETSFKVFHEKKEFASFKASFVGNFNVTNALAAIALSYTLGVSKEKIVEAIYSFKGLKRRQEHIGNIKGAKIIEDFAHHPTSVKEVLKAFRNIEGIGDIWAIFEPRSATTRRKIFESDLCEALSVADKIIIPDPIDRGDIDKVDLFSSGNVVQNLNKLGKKAFNITETESIVSKIKDNVKDKDYVIIMSNGSFGGIYKKLLENEK